MFSIVIPLYNKEHFIAKALDSIFAQSFTDFEIIVVNDGSKDNSLQVVSSFKDSRLKIFNQENQGVSAARNYGIKQASYNYIAFMDADDLWESDYLHTISQMIFKFPTAGLYCTAFYLIDNISNKVISIKNQKNESFLIYDYCKTILLNYVVCWTSAVCIKKEIIDKVGGFRIGIRKAEDLDMWLRIGLNYELAYHPVPKAKYLINTENNIMSTDDKLSDYFPMWEWYKYESKNKKYLSKYTTSTLVYHMQKFYRSGCFKDALLIYKKIKFYRSTDIHSYVKANVYFFLSIIKFKHNRTKNNSFIIL